MIIKAPIAKIKPKEVSQEKILRKISRNMEVQFIKFMVNQMRRSVQTANPMGQEMKYYQGLLDDKYAQLMGNTRNGLGLSNLIYQQLKNKYSQRKHIGTEKPIPIKKGKKQRINYERNSRKYPKQFFSKKREEEIARNRNKDQINSEGRSNYE
jgi:Rod binding domain-containing protein